MSKYDKLEKEVMKLISLSKIQQLEAIENLTEKYGVTKTNINEILKEKLKEHNLKKKNTNYSELVGDLSVDDDSKFFRY